MYMKTIMKEKMTEHLETINSTVTRNRSKLGQRQEEMYSLAGEGMKHLVNALCDTGMPVNYLELGAYRGALTVAAVWDNQVTAYVVDNFKWDQTAPNRYAEEGHPNVETALNNSIKAYKESWKGPNEITVVKGDLEDPSTVKQIDKKIDIVFHDANKKGKWADDFLSQYKDTLDKFCLIAVTKFQDVGTRGSFENALKDNNFSIIAFQPIPDTGAGLDGRSGVGIYYLENKTTPVAAAPKVKND